MTTIENAGGENLRTPGDAAVRRRELIALCAAKTAGLEGVNAERYARSVRNTLVLRPRAQASGTVLPIKKGFRLEFYRQAGPGLLILAMSAAAAISIPHFWIQSLFIAVIGLAFGLPLQLIRYWDWRDKLNTAWSAMLPEVGALIRVDPQNLTIGKTSIPWSDVRLEAVELRYLWKPRIYPTYSVDQLRLATNKGLLVLDVRLIDNGREVIDTICNNFV